jgi:succinate dehydrogenase flavin-adding protein (antitoxin of CptAB toxin-antitoxin module)
MSKHKKHKPHKRHKKTRSHRDKRKVSISYHNKRGESLLFLSSYDITYEPLSSKYIEKLSDDDSKKYEESFELKDVNPIESISILKELIKKYPDIPLLYNNLAFAYSKIGEE